MNKNFFWLEFFLDQCIFINKIIIFNFQKDEKDTNSNLTQKNIKFNFNMYEINKTEEKKNNYKELY